jgi:AraC-like DNA-binding protein
LTPAALQRVAGADIVRINGYAGATNSMLGSFLIVEDYQRILFEFAAKLSADFGVAGTRASAAGHDPLRPRPVADIISCVESIMAVKTDVPMAWRLGEYLTANGSDLLTARARSSATIGEGLEVAHQFQGILTNVRTFSLRSRSDGGLIESHHFQSAQNPAIAFICHSILASKLNHLFHLYPGSEEQHRIDRRAGSFGRLIERFDRDLDFLDIDVRDGEASLGFRRDVLRCRIQNSDERLISAADRELRRRAGDVPATGKWRDQVKFYIRSNHFSEVSLDEICDAFCVTRRTLGRLLRNEGTTFTNVLTEIRRERAIHLVRNAGLPLKRVATELGFNSDASFNMAFKSWTGTTPMKFRNNPSPHLPANDQRQTVFACRVMQQKSLIATYS